MSTTDSILKVIVDTSIYIPYLNHCISHPALESPSVVYMSAVVLLELYAGAHDKHTTKILDKLTYCFKKTGRLIAPIPEDWRKAGIIIAKLASKHGFDRKFLQKLQNDVLIAISAYKTGAFVATNNKKDFLRIKEFVNFNLYP